MPVLDLPPLHLPEAGVYLTAVMFSPREPDLHAQLIQAVQNEALRRVIEKNKDKKDEEFGSNAFRILRQAVTGPTLKDTVLSNPINLISPGYNIIRPDVASRLFIYVLACLDANDPMEPATLEHAREMIGSAGGKYGSLPGLGRSQVIDVWRDFSPVVHLLTAKAVLHTLWNDSSRRGAGSRLAVFLSYAGVSARLTPGSTIAFGPAVSARPAQIGPTDAPPCGMIRLRQTKDDDVIALKFGALPRLDDRKRELIRTGRDRCCSLARRRRVALEQAGEKAAALLRRRAT